MSSNSKNSDLATPSSQESVVVQATLSDESDRRRQLIKSLGKGAAVIAAVAPIQTLAQGTVLLTTDWRRCSVSGMQSGAHSRKPDSYLTCGGYSPGWWQQKNDNGTPKNWPSGAIWNNSYKTVFPKASLPPLVICTGNGNSQVCALGKEPSLWEVMSYNGQGNYKSTDMFHWIGAWLNGFGRAYNFPYTNDQIAALYDDETTRADALALIKGYLEVHGPAPDMG